jgi:hypothetical protein
MTMVDNNTWVEQVVTQSVVADSSEDYYWSDAGIFEVACVSVTMNVDVDREDWPSDELTTTTTVPDVNDTTTTETAIELTSGFEVIFTVTSLIAIPIFFKKRR